MSGTLPRHPNLDHLKKQAKQLLAAHRGGIPAVCGPLRKLHRFSSSTDEDILSADLTLAEAQFALALHYGFSSWNELREEARSHPPADEFSLEAVRIRSEEEIPEYAGAGVPLGIVAALNHAGIDIGFVEFAAASGWAFSFGYSYEDISPAYLAVRGKPGADGPSEVFAFLPLELGLDYEMALTSEPDELWDFVRQRADAGIPVMSEHMDGGLITAYRTDHNGHRQLFFDGTVMPGWIDVERLNPYAVYSFVKLREPQNRGQITRAALHRAVSKGRAHTWNDTPQGLAALRQYLDDVSDPEKDFSEVTEWFCWATFERLMARRCCEWWLRSVARSLPDSARGLVGAAAGHYGEAYRCYDRYGGEVMPCQPPPRSFHERTRTPEQIQASTPHLRQGIEEETAGLDALAEALSELG
ncbi:hypothetical protein ACFL3S_02840 [Gemmatimonadota bacterium]